MPDYRAVNDEPVDKDGLGRDVYARTLQKVIQQCDTPMVIGVHGDWGSGKTSLMRLTQKLLKEKKIRTVWFNPWMYQFEEILIIPLLHEIKEQTSNYINKAKSKGLKLFNMLTSLAGEAVLRITTGGVVKLEDIISQGVAFEEKYFEAKTINQKINKHFKDVVNAIAGGGDHDRLVIFIDDLDRCLPPQALKVLEAIKLFLNAKKCVYVIGIAREVIEEAIRHHYGALNLSGPSYLDKIIQLPFNIPPIPDEKVESYLEGLNENPDIKKHYDLIQRGIGRNPRAVKRFMNSLLLNNLLAREAHIPDYKPHILIKLLIFQLQFPDFYKYISSRPQKFGEIEKLAKAGSPFKGASPKLKKFLESEKLRGILCLTPLIQKDDLKPYIHLAETTKAEPTPSPKREKESLLRDKVEAAVVQGKSLAGANLEGANLVGANLVGANLWEANFWGANLRRANLEGANLEGADLEETNLEEANLEGADLGGADLGGASLWGANLRGANLEGADLEGADLTEVRGFEEVKSFKNARLINAKGLSDEQLEYAKSKGAIIEE